MTKQPPAINLFNLDRKGMENLCENLGYKRFQGRNLLKWIYRHGETDFDTMTDLPIKLRTQLKEVASLDLPEIVYTHTSQDGTVKWVLQLEDGQRVETVYIPDNGRGTLCVSSQVGCSLNCSFCYTARQGFNRNLSTAEITTQLWIARRELGPDSALTNVVFMGMGEPLANFKAVITAINVMQDDLAFQISKHRVVLSTSGIVPELKRLSRAVDVSLAVSLHAATNALRNLLVPINKKYPLEVLIPACLEFTKGDKRRKITWEYVMLDGINDSIEDAKALNQLLEGVPSKINLIPFNTFSGAIYSRSQDDRIETFRQHLKRAGFVTLIRKTRGDDVEAACGQLVGKVNDRSKRQLAYAQGHAV